jgi:hypothetical protein
MPKNFQQGTNDQRSVPQTGSAHQAVSGPTPAIRRRGKKSNTKTFCNLSNLSNNLIVGHIYHIKTTADISIN